MRTFAAMFCGLAAAVAVSVVAVPANAQTPPPTTAKKKQVAVVGRPATRVEVRRRSFLDPGTETKTHQENFLNYAFPPGDSLYRHRPERLPAQLDKNAVPELPRSCGFCNR